jgi:hypothetical protein
MNDPEEVKTQTDNLFCFLNHLYGDRFTPEMEKDLRAGIETVAKTAAVLRSVAMSQVGDPSLPFTPFRKEG